MAATLSVRDRRTEELEDNLHGGVTPRTSHSVNLPTFAKPKNQRSQRAASLAGSLPVCQVAAPQRPQLVPPTVPAPKGRRAPLMVQINRSLRTVLVALCGFAILGYGLDVAASNDIGDLQDQARRLNEQNSELSAKLLKAISYQDIQKSVTGLLGLHVPDHVLIVEEVAPPQVPAFKPNKHQLPIMPGY